MAKLTGYQLYDRRDPARAEMLLVRATHFLWTNRRKTLRGADKIELEAFDAALEMLFEAKRQVKTELKARNAESFKLWKQKTA